jgi:hypothetical protein
MGVKCYFPTFFMRLLSGKFVVAVVCESLHQLPPTILCTRVECLMFPMYYCVVNAAKTPPEAVLKVPPRMTKTEVKEYLGKIYNIKVTKVNTVVQLGKLLSKLAF